MLVTDKELHRIVSSVRNLRTGRIYYQKDYVREITITYDRLFDDYTIEGIVDNGSYENVCKIVIDQDNKITDYSCNCYWCDELSACGHIGAVLLKVQELSPDDFPFKYKSKNGKISYFDKLVQIRQQQEEELLKNELAVTKNLIASFKTAKAIDFNQVKLNQKYDLEVQIKINYGHPCLKFKVGSDKKYIIKNIPNFLSALANNEYVEYGKQLAFVHNQKVFSDEALKIIELMKFCMITYERYQQEYYYDISHVTNEIKIIPESIEYIYEVLKDLEKTNQHLSIYQYNYQPTLHIRKLEKYYSLELKDFDEFCGYKNLYKITENEIGMVKLDDEGKAIKFIHNCESKDKLLLAKEDVNDFVKYILNDIKQYFNYTGDLLTSEVVETEILTLYGDINELEQIKVYLESKQGLETIYSFQQSRKQTSINFDLIEDYLKEIGDVVDFEKHCMYLNLESEKTYSFLNEGLPFLANYCEVMVSDALKKIGKKSQFSINVGVTLEMDVYRAFSLDNKAETSNYLVYDRSTVFKEIIDNFKDIAKQSYPLTPNYQEILRDYQKFGYQWLQSISSYGFGGILADDMGLGKTLQMIVLLDQNRDDKKTSLVVCPSSLLLNWQDEIHKFSNSLSCTCIHGSLKRRKEAIRKFNEVDVLITTYDYMRRDANLYDGYQFENIILDEAQYIKNPKTKNAITVKSLKAKHRFALTGTPIENSLAELWSIFDFLMPEYLYSYHYFKTNYETPIVKNHDENKQQELKKLITPFILRRNKKDVLTELPEKIEKTLSIEFNEEENKLYLANLIQVNKELQEQLNYDNVDRIAILAMLTRLRQICCEPRIIYDNISNISSKLSGCLDLIRNFLGNNQKVLLFSSFTSVLDLIAKELEKESITYYQLTGDTKKEERHRLVNQFQNDDTTVFLISLKAGGTGLNLTAAEAVIHFDPWWNMSAQNQATDRAYRIGQENVVTVYKLVMKDSVEEKILELQNKKKNLADSFVENNEGSITTMSTNDIIELFKV